MKDLAPAFPELVRAGQDLPLGTLLDGEIVIADVDGRSHFGALQERLGVAKRGAFRAACQRPAVLLAFDLLSGSSTRGSARASAPGCARQLRAPSTMLPR